MLFGTASKVDRVWPNPQLVKIVWRRKSRVIIIFQNKEGKEKWRNWCEQYKERVQDYNFGTLLRLDPSDDYTEKNSCFALRVQFLAIEIARNKEGKNQKIFEAAKAAKEAAAKAAAAGKMGGGCCSKCWLEKSNGLTNNKILPFEIIFMSSIERAPHCTFEMRRLTLNENFRCQGQISQTSNFQVWEIRPWNMNMSLRVYLRIFIGTIWRVFYTTFVK